MVVGPIQANCYLVGCKKTKEAVVVDPGGDVPRVVSEIVKRELKIRYILDTHGHWDHTAGNAELKSITKAPLLIHAGDAPQLSEKPDGFLEEGRQIQFGTYSLEVLHTPGHSPGGVCFSGKGVVFTGDTLFAGSIGRTDLPGGNGQQLKESIQRLSLLDVEYLLPGHGGLVAGSEKVNDNFKGVERDWFAYL